MTTESPSKLCTSEEQVSLESNSAIREKAVPDVIKSNAVHVPDRTSSAPPDEHGGDNHKSRSFQPTKTSQGMLSSPADLARKHLDHGVEKGEQKRHDDLGTSDVVVHNNPSSDFVKSSRNESSMGSPAGPKVHGGGISNSPSGQIHESPGGSSHSGPNVHHQHQPSGNNYNDQKNNNFTPNSNPSSFTGYNRQAANFVPQNFVPYHHHQQQGLPPNQGVPQHLQPQNLQPPHLQHMNSPQFGAMQMPPPPDFLMQQFQQYPQFVQPNQFMGQHQPFPYLIQQQQFQPQLQQQFQPPQQQQQRFMRPQQQQFQQQPVSQQAQNGRYQPVYIQQPQMGFPLPNNMVGMPFIPPQEHFQQPQQFQHQRLPPQHMNGPPQQQRGGFQQQQHKPQGHQDNKHMPQNLPGGYPPHGIVLDMNGIPIPDPNMLPIAMGGQHPNFNPYHQLQHQPQQFHPNHIPVLHVHPGPVIPPPSVSHIPPHLIPKIPYLSAGGTPVSTGSPLVGPMGESGVVSGSASKVASSPAPFEPTAALPPVDVKEITDFSSLCDPCEPFYHHCQYTDSNNRLPARKPTSNLTYKKGGEVVNLASFGPKDTKVDVAIVAEEKPVETEVKSIEEKPEAKTTSDSPFLSEQISDPLQALRILSPSLEDSNVEDSFVSPVQASLLKGNLNIPVTLGSSAPVAIPVSIPVSVPVSVSVPVTVTVSVPVSVESLNLDDKTQTVNETAVKKRSKKEILAAADAASGSGNNDLLSAYTADAPLVEVNKSKTPSPELSLSHPAEESTPDSWEDEAVPAMTSNTPVQEQGRGRSLRPGGVKTSTVALTKLNAGFVTKKYTKAELISVKPPAGELKNPFGSLYETMAASEMKGDKTPTPGGNGQWGKQQREQRPPQHNNMKINDPENMTQGNAGWKRDAHNNGPNGPNNNNNNMQGGSPGGNHKNNYKNKQPAPIKPKKLISDPMELLISEAMAVLNKITPQTFEKLSEKMMTIGVSNTSMLDKLIELIFEKAVQEPNFTVVYADLCLHLTNKATNWLFYTIVKDLDSGDFFWIKDFAFDGTAAGPFYSQKVGVAAVLETEDTLPQLVPLTSNLESVETLLTKNLLLKVLFNPANKEYFVIFVPFSNIDEEMRSHAVFPDEEAARKDAQRKNNFRSRLVNSCQNEFQSSVQNESATAQIQQLKLVLKANKSALSEQDFAMQEAQLESELNKLKRRMMGNIRFIGELYKQTLLQTGTMHSCIQELLGSPITSWKELKDDQDIELLCRLLTTVGETLENKSMSSKDKSHYALFNAYFDRLEGVSRDKTLNSRMRFSIEEVLTLRNNQWQARRATEGPAKLAEIAQRVAEDESRLLAQQQKAFAHPSQGHQQQQQYRGNQQGQGGRGPQQNQNQFHHQQQQQHQGQQGHFQQQNQHQQQQQQRVQILSRNNKNTPDKNRGPPDSNDQSRRPSNPSVPQDRQQPSVPQQMQQITPPEMMLTETVAYKRMNGVINEYVRNNGDMPELCLRMSECSSVDYVCLLLQVLQKYIDTSDAKLQKFLLALFVEPQIVAMFLTLKAPIEASLVQFEPFKLLVDTTLDCKMAPERMAVAVSYLIKSIVLTKQYVSKAVADFETFNVDEGNYDAAEIRSVFERFLVALDSNLA